MPVYPEPFFNFVGLGLMAAAMVSQKLRKDKSYLPV